MATIKKQGKSDLYLLEILVSTDEAARRRSIKDEQEAEAAKFLEERLEERKTLRKYASDFKVSERDFRLESYNYADTLIRLLKQEIFARADGVLRFDIAEKDMQRSLEDAFQSIRSVIRNAPIVVDRKVQSEARDRLRLAAARNNKGLQSLLTSAQDLMLVRSEDPSKKEECMTTRRSGSRRARGADAFATRPDVAASPVRKSDIVIIRTPLAEPLIRELRGRQPNDIVVLVHEFGNFPGREALTVRDWTLQLEKVAERQAKGFLSILEAAELIASIQPALDGRGLIRMLSEARLPDDRRIARSPSFFRLPNDVLAREDFDTVHVLEVDEWCAAERFPWRIAALCGSPSAIDTQKTMGEAASEDSSGLHPVVQGWQVFKPKKFQGYTYPLYVVLSEAQKAGEPRPSAADVLDVFRKGRFSEIIGVSHDEVIYSTGKGTKSAGLDAIREAIRRQTIAK